MLKTNKETKKLTEAQMIRKELKEKLNVTSRQVSVRQRHAGYSMSVDVTIKDMTVNKKAVEEIALKYRNVSYCEASGEILLGGNTYIRVEFDYDIKQKASEKLIPFAKKIIDYVAHKKEINSYQIASNGNAKLIYFATEQMLTIVEPNKYNSERYSAYNEYVMAEGLVYFNTQYGFNIN